jgi:hypothetical protein
MPIGSSRAVAWGIAAASLAGLALRLYMLPHRELTYDEAATAYFAALPWGDLWGAAARLETNPPLFYALAGLGARLGLGPEALRMVSILPDAATIVVAGLLAWRLGGGLAGVAAAWLVACSATLIELSLEARAYSWLGLLGLLAIFLTINALRDGRWRWFVALGVVEVLALYTHNIAAIMVGALNGIALVCLVGRQLGPGIAGRWLAVQAAVLVAWGYWLPTVLNQLTDRLAKFWIAVPTLLDLRYAVQKVIGLPWIAWPQPWADGLFIGLGAMGFAVLVRRRGFDRWVALGLAVAVLAGVPAVTWIISQWRPLMNGRVLLWLVPVFIVLVAVGLGRLRWPGMAVAVVLAAAQLQATPFWRPVASAERWPQVADLLRERMRPGDVLFIQPREATLMLTHHGWDAAGYELHGTLEWDWYRAFPGRVVTAAEGVPAVAADRVVWIVTRRSTPQHEAAVARLSATRAEIRLMRGGARADSGVDVSVMVPR